MNDHQYMKAEKYAQEKGFALRNYFLNCIQKGDWPAIAAEFHDEASVEEIRQAMGDDPRFALRALMLVWAQMEHSAVLGGLPEEESTLIYTKCCSYAQKVSTVKELYNLNLQYMRELAYAVASQRERTGKNAPVVLCQRYIQDHLYDDVSPRLLAENLHFSIDHLSRLFKQMTGSSIAEYIQKKKLEEAKRLLVHSTLSIADIGANLNFCSQSYFTSVFRKYEGMTPMQYRNANR